MLHLSAGVLCAALILGRSTPAVQAAEFHVPSAQCPTLQSAVNAAALSPHGVNYIYLVEPRVFTHAEVVLGNEFSEDRKLVIQPHPNILALRRATIVSRNGSQPIFRLAGAGCVAFLDLDIVRYVTNNENLMVLTDCYGVLMDSCRVGSIWNSVGSDGWCNLVMSYPEQVVVRNCIFFSYLPGNFERGISASLGDDSNSVLFYNNVVADHYGYGIEVAAHQRGALVLLRNNVVVNRANLPDAPTAFHSAVGEDVMVVTSHNAAFAELGHGEHIAVGTQSIAGAGAATFLRFDPLEVEEAFVETVWDLDPMWDPNHNFFRLEPQGILHDDPADAGATVTCGMPHPRDLPLFADIEGDPRPNGEPRHTDRGVDQIRENDLLVNLATLTLQPANVLGGRAVKGTVTLTGPAPVGGAMIELADASAATEMPPKITVPAGGTTASFTINTRSVEAVQLTVVTASYRGRVQSQILTIRPPTLRSLVLNPTSVRGGTPATGTVTLETVAMADTRVALGSSHPAIAGVPVSITIPAGRTSANFVVQTTQPMLKTATVIRAGIPSSVKTATLTVYP